MSMLNKPDNELKYYALRQWANQMETGDVNASAVEMQKTGSVNKKVMNEDQMKFVVRLREMADNELRGAL